MTALTGLKVGLFQEPIITKGIGKVVLFNHLSIVPVAILATGKYSFYQIFLTTGTTGDKSRSMMANCQHACLCIKKLLFFSAHISVFYSLPFSSKFIIAD